MSGKHRQPKNPEKLLTTRGDVINFMNYISTDENFCLRVWNTVQGVHERALKEQTATDERVAGAIESLHDIALSAEAVPA